MDAYEQLCGQGVDLIIFLNFSSVATHQEIYYMKFFTDILQVLL